MAKEWETVGDPTPREHAEPGRSFYDSVANHFLPKSQEGREQVRTLCELLEAKLADASFRAIGPDELKRMGAFDPLEPDKAYLINTEAYRFPPVSFLTEPMPTEDFSKFDRLIRTNVMQAFGIPARIFAGSPVFPGLASVGEYSAPPAHPNCRCVMAPAKPWWEIWPRHQRRLRFNSIHRRKETRAHAARL